MDSTIYIKHQNHFKLTILFKDKVSFEAELYENNIPFYVDNNSIEYTRYFFLDIDRGRIDEVLIKTGIVAKTDTIVMTDYSDAYKIYKVYLYIAMVVILLFFIILIMYN